MKICHGGPGYKEDERMHWLSKKEIQDRIGNSDTGCVYGIYYSLLECQLDIVLQNILELERLHSTD